ncbi:protein trichome birefringence-like 8 [Sesamum angolense]|uniref:Protein trichome birefringence-like 8 n=1 Tax=Sesamum angolense TaxID=2727404 RepID=A0AAE2BNR2_9LAMI|nr:protein trichome birefringence-like 8 [Sesamum angolense]
MESGFGMKPYPTEDTPKSARFWIRGSGAMRVADRIWDTKNGDGSHKLVIFQVASISRFDANDFLERSRNGRIVFAGDSIGRNQWESLICMLAQGVSNYSTIYEEHGNPITKHKGSLSIKFQEYNLTVQYYRVPYIVVIDRPPHNAPEEVREGHYFQEKEYVNMTMSVLEAFQRSLNTLKLWVATNLEKKVSSAATHLYTTGKGGEWNKGGTCNMSREPETDYSKLGPEPPNNIMIYEVVEQMKSAMRTINFLNITYLTEFRKDGHPSSNREPGTPADAPEDCSHWCLPGVPDTWNELLYAELLRMKFRTRTTGR